MRTKLLKRVPLESLMDLKIDYAFKQLFGTEKNKEITVIFLNAILQQTGWSPIKDITFINTEAGGEYVNDKQSRLDILVRTEASEQINIEIQFTNKYDMVKRSIYYWSGTYRQTLQKGMIYKELNPVIAINILNFNIVDETDRFHTTYHLYEDEEKFKLTDVMEFHFIEMGKLIKDWKADKLDPWNDLLARWLLMLGMVDSRNDTVYQDIYRELEEIAMKDETLRSAFKSWEEMSLTQEQRIAYESRLKYVLDEEITARNFALMQEKVEEGERNLKEGKKNLETGKRNLEAGKKNLEAGEKNLEAGEKNLEAGEKKLKEEKEKLKEGKENLKEGERTLKKGKQDLEEGKETLKEGEGKLKKKEMELEKKRKILKANEEKLKEKIKAKEEKLKEIEVNLENHKEKEAIAHRLLIKGMDIETIAEVTGLEKEHIKKIDNE